jgi:hypothetical protein
LTVEHASIAVGVVRAEEQQDPVALEIDAEASERAEKRVVHHVEASPLVARTQICKDPITRLLRALG